jgi:hypothetical protein
VMQALGATLDELNVPNAEHPHPDPAIGAIPT